MAKIILKKMVHRIILYFKQFCISIKNNTDYVWEWKSKGLSDEIIKSPTTTNNILNPSLDYLGVTARVKFNGSCLKQDKVSFAHKIIVNIYITYEISKICPINSHPTLENCLFGTVKLTINIDIDQYKYFGYGIGFDKRGKSSVGNRSGRDFIIFGVDMSPSVHVDNKTRYFRSWWWTYTRIRWYNISSRKNVFK